MRRGISADRTHLPDVALNPSRSIERKAHGDDDTCRSRAGIDPNERVVSGLMEFVGRGVRTSVALSREESERRNAAHQAEAA